MASDKARVVWLYGKKAYDVDECHNKSWAYCKWWIQQNKNNPQYAGGLLKVVSVFTRTDLVKIEGE